MSSENDRSYGVILLIQGKIPDIQGVFLIKR